MFIDLKSIEGEIDQFKSNMNSVDGLLSAIKSICSKMDHQISQGKVFLDHLGVIQEETKEQLKEISANQDGINAAQMKKIESSAIHQSERMNKLQNDIEKKQDDFFQMNKRSMQEIQEMNQKALSLISDQLREFRDDQKKTIYDLNQQVEKMVNKQLNLQQFLESKVDESYSLAKRNEKIIRQLGVITTIGFIILGVLIIIY